MTDAELGAAVGAVKALEVTARAVYAGTTDDQERVAAQAAMRQAGALRRALENWIVDRAVRAQVADAAGRR